MNPLGSIITPDPWPSRGTTPYLMLRASLVLSMLTTLSLNLSMDWTNCPSNSDALINFLSDSLLPLFFRPLESPRALSDWLDLHVHATLVLHDLGGACRLGPPRSPRGASCQVIDDHGGPAGVLDIPGLQALVEVPTAE